MGFFSFLSGRPDRIELALPAKDRADFLVYFTAVGGAPPTEGDLVGAALAWLDERVDEPLKTRLRRAIDSSGLLIELHAVEDIPPPPREILAHLSPPGWEPGLSASTHVAVVTAVAEAMVPPVALLTALGAARGIALATDGGVLDPALPRFEDPASFEERFTADWTFVLSEHVVLPFSVDDRGRGWLTSLGLGRFALPELEVRDVPPHLDRHLVPIVNGLALRLVESAWRAPVSDDGERRHLVLEMPLRVGWSDIVASMGGSEADDEGAPPPLASPLEFALEHRKQRRSHDFLRVVRPGDVKLSQGEWLSSLLLPLAGEDAAYHPGEQSGDAMIRAHQAALADLPRVRDRFQAGLAPGEVFAVKKGFDADEGGSEFMWVVVKTWRGTTLRGVLANTPQGVSDLRAGQDIDLSEEEIYDWCLQLADGSMEGALTDKVALGG